MVTNYQHHLYGKQSEYVKYRGKTGQIDVKDTIIAILAHLPGLNRDEIADNIYDSSLRKSRFYNIARALETLEAEGHIIEEQGSGQYYLHNDAMSHDIGKAQDIMNRLTERGVTREQVVFLSTGIIMAGEQARAEVEERNYHTSETVGSSPAIVPPVPEIEEERCEQIVNEVVVEAPAEDMLNQMSEEASMVIANPFENMSQEEVETLKTEVIQQMHEEHEAELQEAARLQMEAEEKAAEIAEAEKIAKEASDKLTKDLAYKNKLSSIKSATSLLGQDVEVQLPDLAGQVVGTILEIKSDSVLFLIVFSQDSKYPEGSIQNIFYKDNLSYKIMA